MMSYQKDLNILLENLEKKLMNEPVKNRFYIMSKANNEISNRVKSLINIVGVETSNEIKNNEIKNPNYIDVHINTSIANIIIDSVINGMNPIDALNDYANKNNKSSSWVEKAKRKPLYIDLTKQLYKKNIAIELNKYGLLGFYNQPNRWTLSSFLKQLNIKIDMMNKIIEMGENIKTKNNEIIKLNNKITKLNKNIKIERICSNDKINWKEKAIELKVQNYKIRYQEIAIKTGMSLSSVKKFMSQNETKEEIKRLKLML